MNAVSSHAGAKAQTIALILIDLQNDYLPTGKFPLVGIESAVKNAAQVLTEARRRGMPIVHVRHESPQADAPLFAAGSSGTDIMSAVAPAAGEPVVTKHQINAYRDTDLKQRLEALGVSSLVIVGAMSHMCIDACVRASVDLGYPVTVLHDACATRDLSFDGQTTPAAQVQTALMAAFEFFGVHVLPTRSWLQAPAG